jgi:hypothetical protein
MAERFYRGPRRIGELPASEWRRLRERLKIADGIDAYVERLGLLSTAELLALRHRLEAAR